MGYGRQKVTWVILTIVFIFFMLFFLFSIIAIKQFSYGIMFNNNMVSRSQGEAEIVVVDVEGVIMSSRKVIENLMKAEKRKATRAIIIRINSPGGAVGPTQEIYEEIRRIDKKIPVYASFGAIAASGGYYLGAAARKIYANPGTLTGSIGVIMHFMDLSKLYKFIKINPEIIKSGQYKDLGAPNKKLSKVERKLMEKLLAGVHKRFINDILETREKKIKGDIWSLAQGQIFSGEDAFEFGLVDELKGLWGAGRAIHKDLKLKSDFDLEFIKSKKYLSVFEIFEKLESSVSKIDFLSWANYIPMMLYNH